MAADNSHGLRWRAPTCVPECRQFEADAVSLRFPGMLEVRKTGNELALVGGPFVGVQLAEKLPRCVPPAK